MRFRMWLCCVLAVSCVAWPLAASAKVPLPMVEGKLGPLELERVQGEIRAALPAVNRRLKACFETSLKRDPNAGGKMVVRFTVGVGGRVWKASVSKVQGSLFFRQHMGGRRCMERAFLRMKLRRGPLTGPATFQVMYVFVSS